MPVLGVLLFTQCTERGVVGPPEAEVSPPLSSLELASVTCRATVRDGSLSCSTPTPLPPRMHLAEGAAQKTAAGGMMVPGPMMVGGQDVYVTLTGSNIVADGTTYGFDVTIENLLGQALGTSNGVALAAGGVRVFFVQEPTVTSGTGTIAIANADGEAHFTATDQPYYQYDEVIAPAATSSARRWEFSYTGDDIAFEFKAYVWTTLEHPDGWMDLSTASLQMPEAGTHPLNAVVRLFDGSAAPNQSVTWGSSDEDVVTIDGDGVVTAVAPGAATITATQGALSASITVSVCYDMAAGEVLTLTFPDASSICLWGGAAGAEFTYMPVNGTTASSVSYTVNATGIVPVTGPPTPGMSTALGTRIGHGPLRDEELHAHMLEADRRLPTWARRISGTRTPAEAGPGTAGGQLIVPGVPAVGDLWDLNVAPGCSGTLDIRTGRVVHVGATSIIVADTTNPAGGFTTAQYDSIGMEIDSLATPVTTTNFGAPTDLDGNGRAVFFYTRAVNELSPPASSVVVNGYFTARDLYSSAPGSCTLSNEGEMLYMLVPDPTGAVNSNVRTVSFVRGGTVGTAAHELQHLINAGRRIYVHSAGLEEVWLNEALSHVAEELMFYQTSVGLAPRGNINLSTLTTGPNASRRVAAFNTYANQNYGRLRSWLQRPDTSGATRSNDVLATRGAAWSFLRYAADRVNGVDSDFWFDLVNTTSTGRSNLGAAIGANVDEWLRDFTVATYADDAVAGVETHFTLSSWNFRSVYGGLGGFPLGIRALSNNVDLTLSTAAGGGTFFARFGVVAGGFGVVTGSSGGGTPTSPFHVAVIRSR